jgi:pimeloyl-ACP methyl ester carboxylesterase
MDVRFDSDGAPLAGTLLEVPDPVAAAVVITGSGRLNRDSDARLGTRGPMLLRTGVTREVAEALGAANVVTLRYDKRGIGASGGDYLRAGMTENLADARSALHWLAARFPGLPLLTVGHSEGTWHAARLAGDEPTVAGTALLAAPAQAGEQVLEWQLGKILPTLPKVVTVISRLTGHDIAHTQRKRIATLKASETDVLRIGGVRANARWFREFILHDPAPDFARITVPVLAITGGHDMQVPPDDVAAIGRLVRGSFEGHVVDDLSHLLRPDPLWKGPRGYRRAVKQPVSPKVLALLGTWAAAHWEQRTAGYRGGV